MGYVPPEDLRSNSGPSVNRTSPLFREEAVRARMDRLAGTVTIAVPVAWQALGLFFLISLAATVVLLSLASHADVETVRGTIVPDSGIANVVTPRAGVVSAVSAKEGAFTKAGDSLVVVRAEEAMTDGSSVDARTAEAVQQQQRQTAIKAAELSAQARAEQARISADINGITAQIAYLDQQIQTQRQMVDSAAAQLEQIQGLARTGFVSGRDLQARKDVVLSREQQLAELSQTRAARLSDLARDRQQAAQSNAESRAQIADLNIGRFDLDQRLTQAQASSAYVLKAPVSGIATAIDVLPGDHVAAERKLMSIVPARYRWEVQLDVPAAKAGLLHVGQKAEISIDAFPYARFGGVSGSISAISAAPVTSQAAVYRVKVRMAERSLEPFSRAGSIRPGMGVTARIVTSRQSLLRWLVTPAAGQR